jgi:hypothetical protein
MLTSLSIRLEQTHLYLEKKKLRRMNALKGKESLQTTANISGPVPCSCQLFLSLFYEAISVNVSLQSNILSKHSTSWTN